jgi:hypothetical protein
MTRPHIEFVQVQHLPWQADGLAPHRAGIDMKVLSRDGETSELSAILRYPPGFARPPECLGVDEEFFVLEGAFTHRGHVYGPDTYGFWPAGLPRGRIEAPGGATVLTFLSGPLSAEPTALNPARLVERIDIREGEWVADLAAMGLTVMASTSRIRRLRSDPLTGEITYVTATIPYWRESQPERHPVSQEIFVLAGETAGNTGIMRPGAYTWRPENVTHGPYGSTTGAVFFFRSRGGALTTEHDPPTPFSFAPAHCPVLPPDLAPYGAPFEGPKRF